MSAFTGKILFIIATLVLGGGCLTALTLSIMYGRALLSAALVLFTSPMAIAIVWVFVQDRQPSLANVTLLNIPYSATVGEAALVVATWFTAKAWAKHGAAIADGWKSYGWLLIAGLIGLGVGIVFHLSGGRADSHSLSLDERLHDAATSWFHNLGIFMALTGALLATILPLLLTPVARGDGLMALCIVIVIWGGFAVIDQYRFHLPQSHPWWCNPHWMDVEMDWAHWRPARS